MIDIKIAKGTHFFISLQNWVVGFLCLSLSLSLNLICLSAGAAEARVERGEQLRARAKMEIHKLDENI